MATWKDVTKAAPELSAGVQRRFDAHIHKALATLRADGSPRVSGQEASFRDGEVWLGMMPESRKARDLLRDPRLALHSATADPEMTGGDAKLSGRAVAVTDQETFDWFVGKEREEKGEEPPQPFHLFRVDIDQIVLTTLGGDPPDHLVIETWHERRGASRVERR
ncbi:MAG TPA: pyridoxamine 5'-phosphate oxidase family protein [Acidimicrobiia bacterium]|nr:pyridoxamine 5'-phosphate oxidase family protein [Acidimicrobiia bacterium]